jgi:outer membrane protein assembly factor BamD (BamD/ComL family)
MGDQEDYVAFRLGQAALNQGDTGRAVESLQKLRSRLSTAGAARPNWWPDVWILLAGAHLREKNYPLLDEVAEELRRLAAGTEAAALLYKLDLLQGRSLENRAMFPEARESYLRVIDSEAGRGTASAAEAQFHIAETYLKENNRDAAYKEYMKVDVGYAVPEFQAPSLLQAAKCDIQSQRWAVAAATLKDLIERFPESKYAADAQAELKRIEPNLTNPQGNPQGNPQ